jgi:hypothetical protein
MGWNQTWPEAKIDRIEAKPVVKSNLIVVDSGL